MSLSKWTAADLQDLAGKTIVVTGASSGIGLVTAAELARAGAHVVLAVRDRAKGEAAAAAMTGDVEVRLLDVSSLASIRIFASSWTGDLDVLINNAGIMQVPHSRTDDGFELQIGTNYLGPFALTKLLLPHITDRVVTMSSLLHTRGRLALEDLNSERRPYRSLGAYCDSKLADLSFALELQRRLAAAGSPVLSIAAHPGIVRTRLFGHISGLPGAIMSLGTRLTSQDAARGALPALFAATQPIAGGSYIGPDGFRGLRGYPTRAEPSYAAKDPIMASRLWDVSVALTGLAPAQRNSTTLPT
jgi:NAD(P)-dependent dehydrogenase (short-subunit alcohol dehydrogenase family)